MNREEAEYAAKNLVGGKIFHTKKGCKGIISGVVKVQVNGIWTETLSYKIGDETFSRFYDDCINLVCLP
jgi:hypothetical protein